MKFMECKTLILSDLARITHNPNRGGIFRYLITNASFKVTFWFRIASWLGSHHSMALRPLVIIVELIRKHYAYKTGIQLGSGTNIGGGLFFPHFSCIVINGGAKVGRNVTIFQGVTIGSVRGKGTPTIGDNVVIFSHAQVVGDITIGNNVMVGAGSVVVKDVPDNAVVAGVPAKMINLNGKQMVDYYCKTN